MSVVKITLVGVPQPDGRHLFFCARCGMRHIADRATETHTCGYQRGRPGLGDMVAAGLSAIGVTKERVSKALGGPCNCPQRQAALNELGRKFGIG